MLAFWGEEQDMRRRKPSIRGMVYPGVLLVILSLAIGLGRIHCTLYQSSCGNAFNTRKIYSSCAEGVDEHGLSNIIKRSPRLYMDVYE